MLWRKRVQILLWVTAYLPLYFIMIYQFINSNDFFGIYKENPFLKCILEQNNILFDLIVISLVIILSLLVYRLVTFYLFKGLEVKITEKGDGENYSVRKYEKLNVNEYTFFLFTLLLPLISLDYESVINLAISFLIIGVVIVIYVKTDFISVCPLFFTSGRNVFKAIISQSSKEEELLDPSLRISAVIITKEKHLNLNNQFRAIHLVGNVYYLTKRNVS
ncbi:hypothetical protein C6W27_22940 [Bacillus paralicheniformis]|uniref:hypothetical protein n=1 Tax=Bacillus paralicheniformis TaxID=1648923 RepID=UPI000D02B5C4|nr:hypothetical protein [Bacillus paralicheniformis]PRS08068.1 hypothetical protein C6W27_22940 [Bacillus paralicheniformis]